MLASCAGSGPDYYREQGTSLSKSLLLELKKVRTREEYLDRRINIEKLYFELQALIVEADKYLKAHPEIEMPLFTRQNQEISDNLQLELNRLFRLEGCPELLNEMLTQKEPAAPSSGRRG